MFDFEAWGQMHLASMFRGFDVRAVLNTGRLEFSIANLRKGRPNKRSRSYVISIGFWAARVLEAGNDELRAAMGTRLASLVKHEVGSDIITPKAQDRPILLEYELEDLR
ncbi:hypothetical protein [Amantichitinum ursilacus]|uniref:Uncharacterized protein n=1 Tax=Amantichitinum ursilacus TaxID=857265 RepID=A0A0N0XHY7_9NEIS|nr:hypothetical protein [Amantichitinum ursilacus]KPC52288.1 hypothetical protein WG78_14555 [Amantichitinum ursilacus]